MIDTFRKMKWRARVGAMRGAQRLRFPGFSTRSLPIILGNAMAKSGSHILSQFLEGLSSITPVVFTDQHPIRTITPDGRKRASDEVLSDLARLRPGDIGWGYLPGREPYLSWLSKPNVAHFFLYRDPRDKIVSHVFYALDIHEGHAMRMYLQELPDMEARIEATIHGVPGLLEDIRTVYESYLAWLEQPGVMALRFEDLVNQRQQTLREMLAYLEGYGLSIEGDADTVLTSLNQAMSPEYSPTFRKGQSGSWRNHFTPLNVSTFKEVSGDLLIRLKYEESDNWSALISNT